MNAVTVITIIVSIVVLIVQYAQWRTANQKVVVDLYDRRLAVYTELEDALRPVLREGNATSQDFMNFARAANKARFLFGREVLAYLQLVQKRVSWISVFTDEIIDGKPNRDQLIDLKSAYLEEVIDFFNLAPEKFGPYMNLTQRNTPFWRPWE